MQFAPRFVTLKRALSKRLLIAIDRIARRPTTLLDYKTAARKNYLVGVKKDNRIDYLLWHFLLTRRAPNLRNSIASSAAFREANEATCALKAGSEATHRRLFDRSTLWLPVSDAQRFFFVAHAAAAIALRAFEREAIATVAASAASLVALHNVVARLSASVAAVVSRDVRALGRRNHRRLVALLCALYEPFVPQFCKIQTCETKSRLCAYREPRKLEPSRS